MVQFYEKLSPKNSMFSKIKHNEREREVNGSVHKNMFRGEDFNIKNSNVITISPSRTLTLLLNRAL